MRILLIVLDVTLTHKVCTYQLKHLQQAACVCLKLC